MATFQVPQFIEEKTTIVGPFTMNQFLYIAGAGALSLISFYVFNFFLWILITGTVGAFAVALAFIKVDGQELPKVLGAALVFTMKPRTYIWQRVSHQKTLDVADLERIENLRKNVSIQEKLKSIALSITTTTKRVANPEEPGKEKGFESVTFMTGEHRLAKRIDY